MQNIFQVAIHYGKSFGRIEYDPSTKTATVILDNSAKRKAVEDYLRQSRIMPHARETLLDLERLEIKPLDSVETFKLALTNLWETTEVLVDWSRPADDTYRV
jgi:hypothetical protein